MIVFFEALTSANRFLDLIHLVLMTHGVYHYLVRNFDDFLALQDPTWYAHYSRINTITDEIKQELAGQLGHH